MTNWMTAVGVALIAGGLATLICFRSVLFGGGEDRDERRERRADRRSSRRGARRRAREHDKALAIAPDEPVDELVDSRPPVDTPPAVDDDPAVDYPAVDYPAVEYSPVDYPPAEYPAVDYAAVDYPAVGFEPVDFLPGDMHQLGDLQEAPSGAGKHEADMSAGDLREADLPAVGSHELSSEDAGVVEQAEEWPVERSRTRSRRASRRARAAARAAAENDYHDISDFFREEPGEAERFADPVAAEGVRENEVEPADLYAELAEVALPAEEEEVRPERVKIPSRRRVDRSDRSYGDRVDGWVRPHYQDAPVEVPAGEYWTPIPVELGLDPEPSASGYGWPIPVERLPPVPDYEPATGFDLPTMTGQTLTGPTMTGPTLTGPTMTGPTAAVPAWPPLPDEGASRVRLPKSWAERNENSSAGQWRTWNEAEPKINRRRPRPRPRPIVDNDAYISRHAADQQPPL